MAVKKSFQDEQGNQWQAYWNGKKYAGEKVYVTVSGTGKREFRVTFSPADGVDFGGAYGSLDCAKLALRVLEIIE